MWKKYSSPLFSLILLLAVNSTSYASGFALIEQSVSGLGNAFAGGAASAEDATTVFFNPAGMTRLADQQTSMGLHVIAPSTKFTAAFAPTNALGTPIRNTSGAALATGPSGGEGGVTGIAPNLYYVNKINDKLAIGLGINAPFGLSTEYDKTWAGRYHAIESDVKTININPSVAYKVTDQLSIGAGFNAQYIDATLSSMADFGLQATAGLYSAAQAAAAGGDLATAATLQAQADALVAAGAPSNPNADVFSEISADDWSYGFNLGLLFEFTPESRAGLAYRSKVKHKLTGDADFTIQNSAYLTALGLLPTAQGTFVNQGANGSIDLPASASLSLYHQFSDTLAFMADVTWTEWSSFDKLVMNFTGTLATSPSVTTENWDDTWRYSIGASYKVTKELTLRTGAAYDETPISDNYRTPRIPGEDRFWLALGAGYQFTDNLVLDCAYAHLFVADSNIHKTATLGTEDEGRGTIIGSFENSVDIASVQVSYKF